MDTSHPQRLPKQETTVEDVAPSELAKCICH